MMGSDQIISGSAKHGKGPSTATLCPYAWRAQAIFVSLSASKGGRPGGHHAPMPKPSQRSAAQRNRCWRGSQQQRRFDAPTQPAINRIREPDRGSLPPGHARPQAEAPFHPVMDSGVAGLCPCVFFPPFLRRAAAKEKADGLGGGAARRACTLDGCAGHSPVNGAKRGPCEP